MTKEELLKYSLVEEGMVYRIMKDSHYTLPDADTVATAGDLFWANVDICTNGQCKIRYNGQQH
jgi:hypothetical protein